MSLKFLSVAKFEFGQAVLKKTFWVTLALMPIIYGVMFLVIWLGQGIKDTADKRIAIVDRSGIVFDRLTQRAEERNRGLVGSDGKKTDAPYLLEAYAMGDRPLPEVSLELSEAVRKEKLFAYVIIGADAVAGGALTDKDVRYHSGSPSNTSVPSWLSENINEIIVSHRLRAESLNEQQINNLTAKVGFARYGLVRKTEDGKVEEAKRDNRMLTFMLPFGVFMIMFFAIGMASWPMLSSVMEEKQGKIAEVLVSSVTPFDLIFGKLLASVASAVIFSGVYLLGTITFLATIGALASITPMLVFWFFIFAILAMLMHGSLYAAIGSVCQDLKDTQNFYGVTLPLSYAPMFSVMAIMENPHSQVAQILGLIPVNTPFVMIYRLAVPPYVQWWEPVVGAILTLAFALGIVWAAAKVFRVGILSAGTTPKLGQVLKWVTSKT